MDRDCNSCIHHTEKGCSAWSCKYVSKEQAIRSLEAWEKVKDRLRHGGDFVFEDQNAFYSDSILAIIDKALGEVGEKE